MMWLLWACTPEVPVMLERLQDELPLVIAHRGGDDLAPESTQLAFERAWEAGSHVLEMDVRRTEDGVLHLFHDDTLDRTTDGTGSIEGLVWDDFSGLDAGYWWTRDEGETYPYRGQGLTVPTLEEVFAALPDAVYNLDIKSRAPQAPAEVIALVKAYGLEEQVCVGSFDDAIGLAFQEGVPGACTYSSEGFARWRLLGDLLPTDAPTSPRFDVLAVPVSASGIRVVDAAFVERTHARGQQVWVWTVNEQAEMQELLELGVDGLITDEIELALQETE